MQQAMERRRRAAEEERARQQAILAKEKAEADAARAKAREAHVEATRVAKQQARERRIAQRKLDAARREAQRLEWEAALKADKLVSMQALHVRGCLLQLCSCYTCTTRVRHSCARRRGLFIVSTRRWPLQAGAKCNRVHRSRVRAAAYEQVQGEGQAMTLVLV